MKKKYNVSLENTFLGPIFPIPDNFFVSVFGCEFGLSFWFSLNSFSW